jgi:tetratricopeptide (TPR) repeat protein
LEKLIAENKNFGDLLLLISLLDSKNIPRDLIDSYKGRLVVDNFIYNLRKYSLVMNPPDLIQAKTLLPYVSIHRSTQDISFIYLNSFLKLNKDNPLIKSIVCILDNYVNQAIEQEDFSRMRGMVEHLEKFLSRADFLSDFSQGLLGSKLGCLYYYFNNSKCHQAIKGSLDKLKMQSPESLTSEDNLRIARSFVHIGAICTELRLYKEAQEALEKVTKVYGNNLLSNSIELSWALTYLGNIHRELGNYEKARDYLEKSMHVSKHHRSNSRYMVCTLSCLGSVYRGLGMYQRSIDILEESLILCKKYYPEDHLRVGRILKSLGTVYRRLGDFKKAKQYQEYSLLIFKKYFPETHINIGSSLAYLGICLRELGEYDKSRDYLEQSLKIHQGYFDENHPIIGWILFQLATTYKSFGKYQKSDKLFEKVLEVYEKNSKKKNIETPYSLREMARVYLEKNQLEEAYNFINRSLNILKNSNHVDMYESLEVLGEIYLKKSLHVKNSQDSQNLKNQAIDQFNQALNISKKYFTEESAHVQRIQSKIKNLQEITIVRIEH